MSKRRRTSSSEDQAIYFKHREKFEDKSSVWFYYLKSDAPTDKRMAKCNLCHVLVDNRGGSTGKMWSHLSKEHQINQEKKEIKDNNQQASMSKFVRKKLTIEERVVRLITIENVPFSKLSTQTFREMFLDIYNDVPKSPNTFKSIMLNYSDKIKSEYREKIRDLIGKDVSFCASFDEWTSNALRR